MCGIVASAVHTPAHTTASPSFPGGSNTPEVLWRDDNFTVYRERAYPVSSKGHLIFVFKSVHFAASRRAVTSDGSLYCPPAFMYHHCTPW